MLFILGSLVAAAALVAYARLGKLAHAGDVAGAGRAGAAAVAGLGVLLALAQMLTVIPAGHIGVVDFFGSVSPDTLKAGINTRNPLAMIHKFSV